MSALVLIGCAPLQPAHRASVAPPVDPVVEVDNDHWHPVQVHVIWSGSRYFLGDVAPGRTARFRVPRALVAGGTIQLLADAMGSSASVLAEPVRLDGGRTVTWRLRKNLESSRILVL